MVLPAEAPALAHPVHSRRRRCRASAPRSAGPCRAARTHVRIPLPARPGRRRAGAGSAGGVPARLRLRKELRGRRARVDDAPRARRGLRGARPRRAPRGGARPRAPLRQGRTHQGTGPHPESGPAHPLVRRPDRRERRRAAARRGDGHRGERCTGECGAHRRRDGSKAMRLCSRRVHSRASSPTTSGSDCRSIPSAAITSPARTPASPSRTR